MSDNRYGMTVPFDAPLHQQADLYRELSDLGYTDLWSSEADGTDGFTPLVLASQWAPEMRLGIAIIPADVISRWAEPVSMGVPSPALRLGLGDGALPSAEDFCVVAYTLYFEDA